MCITVLFWMVSNIIMVTSTTPVLLSALVNFYVAYITFKLLSKEI